VCGGSPIEGLAPAPYPIAVAAKVPASIVTSANSTMAATMTIAVYAPAYSAGAFIRTGRPRYSR